MRTRRPDVARLERSHRTLVTALSLRGIGSKPKRLINLVGEIVHKVELESRFIGHQGVRDRRSPIAQPYGMPKALKQPCTP